MNPDRSSLDENHSQETPPPTTTGTRVAPFGSRCQPLSRALVVGGLWWAVVTSCLLVAFPSSRHNGSVVPPRHTTVTATSLPLKHFALRGPDSTGWHNDQPSPQNTTTTTTTTTTPHRHLIAGGAQAPPGDFPYFVKAPMGFCGGALIASRVVLTAAHCNATWRGSGVIVGGNGHVDASSSSNNTLTTATATSTPRRVVQKVIHPQFDPISMAFDVMLVQLDKDVAPFENTSSIIRWNNDHAFPRPYPNDNYDVLRVMGYGLTVPTSNNESSSSMMKASESLRYTELLAYTSETCQSMLPTNLLRDPDIMMCAAYPNVSTGACQGDSGGPLVMRRRRRLLANENDDDDAERQWDTSNDAFAKEEDVVVGIVSFSEVGSDGRGICGSPSSPTIYTRVSAVSDWITRGVACLSADEVTPTNHCILDLSTLPKENTETGFQKKTWRVLGIIVLISLGLLAVPGIYITCKWWITRRIRQKDREENQQQELGNGNNCDQQEKDSNRQDTANGRADQQSPESGKGSSKEIRQEMPDHSKNLRDTKKTTKKQASSTSKDGAYPSPRKHRSTSKDGAYPSPRKHRSTQNSEKNVSSKKRTTVEKKATKHGSPTKL